MQWMRTPRKPWRKVFAKIFFLSFSWKVLMLKKWTDSNHRMPPWAVWKLNFFFIASATVDEVECIVCLKKWKHSPRYNAFRLSIWQFHYLANIRINPFITLWSNNFSQMVFGLRDGYYKNEPKTRRRGGESVTIKKKPNHSIVCEWTMWKQKRFSMFKNLKWTFFPLSIPGRFGL